MGAPALNYASRVASLSVLREIAIFDQHRFVNLFTDKRINAPYPNRRGTSLRIRLPTSQAAPGLPGHGSMHKATH